MRIEQFDPARDSEAVRACHEMYVAGAPADTPRVPPLSLRAYAGWMARGWTEDPVQAWLARDGNGGPVGWYQLVLPERENRHLAGAAILVNPARRRAGIGTALLRHAAMRAREAGRDMLGADCLAGTPGEAFARALAARQGITEVHRLLRLGSVSAGHLAALKAQTQQAAAGYSLVSWQGPAPPGRLAAVTSLFAASADMPHDPGQVPQTWDTERVLLDEARIAAQGLRFYTVGACGDATGELAALTQLGVDPSLPAWGVQELTVVTRPHRGHRLGLLVKLGMLGLLAEREPQLEVIITGNADANTHMININAQLGFEVLEERLTWELPVERALALPARGYHGAAVQS